LYFYLLDDIIATFWWAYYATQDSLEDIQVKIVKNIELPPEEVNTLVDETKLIFNSWKFSCEGKYDNFDDIMDDVTLQTSQVISIMSKSYKHG